MLPSALVSTYRQYKQDTDSIAAWLASTAKSLGYPLDRLSHTSKPADTAPSGGRLKGKARKQAQINKQSASSAGQSNNQPQTNVISIRDYIPLAQYIAEKAVAVPRAFSKTIDRVIYLRSDYGSKLREHGQVLEEDSDARHLYFIQVLERVREVLKTFVPVEKVDHDQTPSALSHLYNRFAGLAVHEPSDEFLSAPDVERPVQVKDDSNIYESEPPMSREDALFPLRVLINDLKQVSHTLKWIWAKYKSDSLDLVAAAIATNTAIDLVRCVIEDSLPLLNLHGGVCVLLTEVYMCQCLAAGWSENDLKPKHDEPFNCDDCDTYQIAYDSYFSSYQLVRYFSRIIESGNMSSFAAADSFALANGDRSKFTGCQKLSQDTVLLYQFLTQIMHMVRHKMQWPAKDGLIHEMKEMIQTTNISLYTAFAAQTFLDISYILGPDIQRPFTTMMEHAAFISSDIEAHFEFDHGYKLKPASWPASNDVRLRRLQRDIDCFYRDNLSLPGGNSHAQSSNTLFCMSPVMSGMELYYVREIYHNTGLVVDQAWGSIKCSQHLYNALRQQKLLNRAWPDMDFLYMKLGPSSFFVGSEEPKTADECFRSFSIQAGMSAAAFAPHRKNASMVSKAGARGLKDCSPGLEMFKELYMNNMGRFELTAEHVSRIVELSLSGEKRSRINCNLAQRRAENADKFREKKRQRQKQRKVQDAHVQETEGGCMAMGELIKSLCLALQAEMPEFAFPYLRMHRVCFELLRDVTVSCKDVLQEVYPAKPFNDKVMPPTAVGWLLMAASTSFGDSVGDVRPLRAAAQVVDKFLVAGEGESVIRDTLVEKLGIPVFFLSKVEDGDEDTDRSDGTNMAASSDGTPCLLGWLPPRLRDPNKSRSSVENVVMSYPQLYANATRKSMPSGRNSPNRKESMG